MPPKSALVVILKGACAAELREFALIPLHRCGIPAHAQFRDEVPTVRAWVGVPKAGPG